MNAGVILIRSHAPLADGCGVRERDGYKGLWVVSTVKNYANSNFSC